MRATSPVGWTIAGGIILGDVEDDSALVVDDEEVGLALAAWSLSGGRLRHALAILHEVRPEVPWAAMLANAMDAWDRAVPDIRRRGTLLALAHKLRASEVRVNKAKEKLEQELAAMKLVDELLRRALGDSHG